MSKPRLLFGLVLLLLGSPLCSAAIPETPDDIARYYEDFNRLTMLKLQPPKDDFADQRAFTLEPAPTEISAAVALEQRLNEQRLTVEPQFSPPYRPSHDLVLLRPTTLHEVGDRVAVRCEVYEPSLPPKDNLSPQDFRGMKPLRSETHHWRKVAGQWILLGEMQELVDGYNHARWR